MQRNHPLAGAPEDYSALLGELTARIREAQLRAGVAVNRELILLYWGIGKDILARQKAQGWGAKVIDRLAADLKKTFPDVRGFSARNLRHMRDLAREFPEIEIWQQLLPNCPWGHLLQIMTKLKEPAERKWYLRTCIERLCAKSESGYISAC